MPSQSQNWFEMRDVRRRSLDAAVWIPLRASEYLEKIGDGNHAGHRDEFYGVGSLAVPLKKREQAAKLEWTDIGLSTIHRGQVAGGRFIPSDVYEHYRGEVIGLNLVLDMPGSRLEKREWHLHQDFVATFGLRREGQVWVRPEEGYLEVAKLFHAENGSPERLEVRASHLKDYLCARGMALYLVSYRRRSVVSEDREAIEWEGNYSKEEEVGSLWEGRITEIHEGSGDRFGAKASVIHVSRTDIDPQEDVPVLGVPTNDNLSSRSWITECTGRKLYRVSGQLWRNEWIEPGLTSPIVRGDETPPTAFFYVDSAGTQESKKTLRDDTRGWLWFNPAVICVLAHRRGGSLAWHTKATGEVECSPGCEVHFGLNSLGLVTVYAVDMVRLPDWQQKIWSGYNVLPDGKVCEELLASQVNALPANTVAPEAVLGNTLENLSQRTLARFRFRLFRSHDQLPTILALSHRFRATHKEGLLALAKDLARLTVESIDTAAIQKIVPPPKNVKWGSLKSLENLVAKNVGAESARTMIGPLVGIYELRNADAHLARGDLDTALKLAGVDNSAPLVWQGYQLLHACVDSLSLIGEVLGAPKQ